ncbi:hypothetical protein M9Y10_022457 [Tritrichomonas musculus]|uniref:Uncharacterized protein n=1 Tax=Tritrichomonas musculus TaxID=1915356 RepID=A0ABR2KSD0_9EUKA
MFALFLTIAFSVRENERRVCVCNDACPKVCDVFEKILIYYTPDLDAEFAKLKTKYMDVRFCHAPSPFTFNIGTFDGCEVQFDSFHLAPKAQIKVMVTRASTAEPSFNNLVVTFAGHSPSQELDIKAIKFNEVDSHNENIAPRLITQSFEASNSVYDFTDVTIKKECSDPALSIDILKGYNLELTIGENIVTLGSSTFHFEGKSTATISTELKDVKLTVNGIAEQSMPYLILIGFPHTTFTGIYPSDYIIQMQNLEENTVIAAEERLPISLDGARVNVYVSQPDTIIEGDSSCDVNLYTKAQPAQRYTVTIVKLNGNIDIFSSWLDVNLKVFNPGLQIWEAPWSFCVGRGGVSTLTIANTLYTGTSPVSAFKYHCDFKIYLDDDELRNLLKNQHTILTVNTNKTVFTADSVSIIPVDNLDVPGFASTSNCISIEIAQRYPFQIALKAVSPTTLPLKLCYADEMSQCIVDSDGFYINSFMISNLTHCIHPGFNNVVLTLKKDLASLNFGSLAKSQKDLVIEIRSKLSKNPTLGSIIGAKKEIVKSIGFTNINIGGGQIECDKVSFTGCNRNPQAKALSFVTTALVNTDDISLSIFDKDVTNLRNLYLRLSKRDSIHASNNLLSLSDSQSTYAPVSIDTSNIASLTINAVDTLYLNTDNNNKEFQIEHVFTEKTSKNQLILNSTLSSTSTITYNHSNYDVEIARGPNAQMTNVNIIGSGEVSYVNDYQDYTRICITDDAKKCTRYSYKTNNIVTSGDQGARIHDVQESKVYVDTYVNYNVNLGQLSNKVVIFENFNPSVSSLKINCQTKLTSPETSSIKIINYDVQINLEANTQLGHLELVDCTFQTSGFSDKVVRAVDFIGPFSALKTASGLEISGYIELYDTVSFSKSFDISKNTRPRRFRACIPDKAIVTVTNDKIKINDFEIKVGHNDQGIFDVDLYTDKNSTFTLTTSGGEMSQFPKIKFSKLISSTVNFEGQWAAETNPNNFKLVFAHTQYDFNFNVNTNNVPAIFETVQMNFNIVAQQQNVNFYGLFNVASEEYHEMTISGQNQGSISFKGGIGVDHKSWIKILSPITVTVSEVLSTNSNKRDGTISFINYVRAGANSKVIITNPLKNINFNPVFQIYGDFTQSLDSDEIQSFLATNVDLCRINPNDIAKFKKEVKSVQFVEPYPKTHGFVGSNFEVYIPEETAEAIIYLRKKEDPIHTPARACYGTEVTTNCDYIVSDDDISSFTSLLPKSIEKIEFSFGKDSQETLNLNNEKIQNVNLTIKSSTSKPVKVKLAVGSGHINHLVAENIDFEIGSNDDTSIKSAKFVNSISNSLNGIEEIEYDFNSWKRQKVNSFNGKFLLEYPETDITFKSDGWSLDDTDILATNFPNFSINFTTASYVYLKVERDITEVVNCNIYIRTNNIEVGRYWNFITAPTQINIVTEKPLNEIAVTCQSYPFTVLPISNGTTVKFGRDTLPIHTQESISLNNQKFTIDFSLVEDRSDSRLYIDKGIILEGNSMIYFPNSKNTSFPCIAKEVVAQDGSESSATDIYVTDRVAVYGNSKLSSSINFSDATVEFHWWGDHMPYLDNQIEIFPRGVTVFFDGSVSESGYIKDKSYPLVNVGPNCNRWLQNVKYDSKEKQFRGKKSRSQLICEDGFLKISGSKSIRTLSIGAIAGIVVGCVAVVAIIVVVVVLVIKKKRSGCSINSGGLLTSSLTEQ